MKIKLLIFLLLFSFCSSDVVDEGIFIDPVDLKNLKILETNEDIDLSNNNFLICLLYTSPSPRDATLSRMPSSA